MASPATEKFASLCSGALIYLFLLAVGCGFVPVHLGTVIKNETARRVFELVVLRMLPLFVCGMFTVVIAFHLMNLDLSLELVRPTLIFGLLLLSATLLCLEMMLGSLADIDGWLAATLAFFIGFVSLTVSMMRRGLGSGSPPPPSDDPGPVDQC